MNQTPEREPAPSPTDETRRAWVEQEDPGIPTPEEDDPSLRAVDLYAIDAMYADAAARGRADLESLDRVAEQAMRSGPGERRAGAEPRRMTPTRDQRAIAAQRWEQNRRYVEERQQRVARDD